MWRKPLPLQLRLAVLVTGTMLPLVILSVTLVYQNYQSSRNAAAARVMQATRGTMADVDRELNNLIGSLEVLALSPALHRRDLKTFRAEAQRYLTLFPSGHDITVSDASGQMLLDTAIPEGEPLAVRTTQTSVRAVFTEAKPVVAPMFIGALKQRPIFTIDVPVVEGGEVIYDLAFDPPMALFANLITQQHLPDNWVISIFDRDANQVARRPLLEIDQINKASPTLHAKLRESNQGIAETISLEGAPLLTAFARSTETGWIVAMGIPSDTLTSPARQALLAAILVGTLFIAFGLYFSGRMASQIARAEAHRDLLIHELDHRVRNTLSTVQSIVARTLQDAPTIADAKKAIEGRLIALARAHSILGSTSWKNAEFRDVISSMLEPFALRSAGRVRLNGPSTLLRPQAAIALTMVLNELATNAAKYGALAAPNGQVAADWSHTEADGERRFHLRWEESGGPPVTPSTRRGFGSVLIERIVAHELRGKVSLELPATGLICLIEIPLREIAVRKS
jgi:two-component sensor histidine kinase